jgi:hypothetical protein
LPLAEFPHLWAFSFGHHHPTQAHVTKGPYLIRSKPGQTTKPRKAFSTL